MTKGISRIPSPVVWVIALVFCYGAFSFAYSETDSRVLLELPTSLCASILLFRIFERFDYSKMTLWLSSIGKYTLGIYLTHFMLIKVPGIIGISQSVLQLSILPFSIIIIFICVLFQYCTCRSNILGALLFGKNWTSIWEK